MTKTWLLESTNRVPQGCCLPVSSLRTVVEEFSASMRERRCPLQAAADWTRRCCGGQDCTAWTVKAVSPVKTVVGQQPENWTLRVSCSLGGFEEREFLIAQDTGRTLMEVLT
jgi:hypothetical protein